MLGVPPALANTKFPVASSDVIGREPPDARAKKKGKLSREERTLAIINNAKCAKKQPIPALLFL